MAPNQRDERLRSGPALEAEPKPYDPNPPPIHPSFIQVARPFVFEETIQGCLDAMGVNRTREESLRLLGVAWIDNVRRALHLPVRTSNTAVKYYHRFRLIHPDSEYNYVDAAAAALFTACKIEDTLKKSRDIVCAAYNLKLLPSEHLTPDDPVFETNARSVIGLERLMLEAFGFDFRTRHPQKPLIKLARHCNFTKESKVYYLAWEISLDLYRTFAPLKQTTQTMAFSCLELAVRLLDQRCEPLESGVDYAKWSTSRGAVMETLLDLLELYTHSRTQTSVGPNFPPDQFLKVRIPLNQEIKDKQIPRYTSPWNMGDGSEQHDARGKQPDNRQRPYHPLTPVAANGDRRGESERGRDAPLRFILDPAWAAEEKRQVGEYFKVEMEEYEVEE
ncbi:uncharacterized protein N7496_010240 [Penicillium cataractarum]|uniref:RNA polymerase II holoenzyme cyclin-like subunit n=1 Tax=Penicillium cataractarum TaxID=2100454 RepID=A0A9W9V0P6_9EURO|nr:uncharacterized protein N7496_010240 [Penicillium cataractarum]KAJ5364527.1 hypothetical protein N7496_010240 [Penicillium cataractarum]